MFMKSLIFYVEIAGIAMHVLVLNIAKYEWYSIKCRVNYGFFSSVLDCKLSSSRNCELNVLKSISITEMALHFKQWKVSEAAYKTSFVITVEPQLCVPVTQTFSTL